MDLVNPKFGQSGVYLLTICVWKLFTTILFFIPKTIHGCKYDLAVTSLGWRDCLRASLYCWGQIYVSLCCCGHLWASLWWQGCLLISLCWWGRVKASLFCAWLSMSMVEQLRLSKPQCCLWESFCWLCRLKASLCCSMLPMSIFDLCEAVYEYFCAVDTVYENPYNLTIHSTLWTFRLM